MKLGVKEKIKGVCILGIYLVKTDYACKVYTIFKLSYTVS